MVTRLLADYVANVSYDKMPTTVVKAAKLAILDWMGSALRGSRERPAQIVRELVSGSGGHEEATFIGDGRRGPMLAAACANGTASHILEQDDVHKTSILHAATVVIPAAFALAEARRLDGRDLIRAVVCGYETGFRIGEAVTPTHYRHFHTTGTVGTFAAAAACANLLRLSPGGTVHALGSAGTQAAGLWEFIEDGAMSKHLHAGKAAMNGLFAALLAERGFTGASRILEGNRGFFEAMAPLYDSSKVTHRLGETWKILENSYKVFASCRHTHPAMDAALAVREQLLQQGETPDDIVAVTVETYQVALDITGNGHRNSVFEAKFSLPFCVALILINGSGYLDDFEQHLGNPRVHRLMDNVRYRADETFNQRYPSLWSARIRVETKRGEWIREVAAPKGDPENPVSEQELVAKFHRLTAPVMPEVARRNLVERLLRLETVDDVSAIWGGNRI